MGKITTGKTTKVWSSRNKAIRKLIYEKFGVLASFLSYNNISKDKFSEILVEEESFLLLKKYLENLPKIDRNEVYNLFKERYVTIINYQRRNNCKVNYSFYRRFLGGDFSTLKYHEFAIKIYINLGLDKYIFAKFEL